MSEENTRWLTEDDLEEAHSLVRRLIAQSNRLAQAYVAGWTAELEAQGLDPLTQDAATPRLRENPYAVDAEAALSSEGSFTWQEYCGGGDYEDHSADAELALHSVEQATAAGREAAGLALIKIENSAMVRAERERATYERLRAQFGDAAPSAE
jgi:hypothetical protein